MPGRLSMMKGAAEINARFGVDFADDEVRPWHNLKPSHRMSAIVEEDGKRRGVSLRWGLVPAWAKDHKIGNKLLKGRVETLLEKPVFKPLVSKSSGRCLVVVDGYYEWVMRDRRSGPAPPPYHFTLAGRELFSLPGVCARWEDPEGEEVRSFALLTVPANREVVELTKHDRMPAIFTDSEQEDLWLDPATDGPAAVGLLTTIADGALKAEQLADPL